MLFRSIGTKTYPDGTGALELGSMEYIKDDAYIAELLLLTVYMVFAIAALYFIRIRRKLKKAGRYTARSGSAFPTFPPPRVIRGPAPLKST